jgi:hypothetical protein
MQNEALDKQVIEGETITIEDVKQFVIDAKEKRADYLNVAMRSWNEIEKRNKKGRVYGGNDLDRRRRWTRFPLWWSCLKIRQPITLARLPVPVLKDTQGDDPYGRTACVIGERLTRGILKTFDPFSEFASANDDFLVTNFGWGRWFYKKTDCKEEERIQLQVIEPPEQEPQIGPDGQPIPSEPMPPIFVTPQGEVVQEPLFDDMGPHIKTGAIVEVENEEVYFEAGLFSNFYFDPTARKWNAGTRIAFEYEYSYREFIARFGKKAFDKLDIGDQTDHKSNGKPIKVVEYHDKFLKEVRWFADNSTDFFQPLEMMDIDVQSLEKVEGEREEYDNSDLYGLTGFFPCTEPLLFNASTREFWPTPEYFQVADIIDDIHSIVDRMVLLTKAIRVRFFFDSSITQLQSLIGETGEGGGLGIPNLEQTLMAGGGKLTNLVAYFPVDDMITGLSNMYTAFEQRLNMFYQVTGLSDLIRGQTNPDSDKTFGERQMEGKFALNRIEPFQRRLQEWIKDNYQLGMELALKMFSDKSLDEYITPQTLDKEDKDRYIAALEMLKNNKRSRFRVDFETDSTIAINEQWKRSQAVELANTLTKAMESVANVAETQPELAGTELAVLKHLIGEFSDGKLFVDEIQDSIQQVIDKVSQPGPPAPDYELEKLKMQSQQLGADMQFKQLQLQSNVQLEYAKLQQKAQQDNIKNQLDQIKVGIENGLGQQELQLAVTKLQSDIAQGWQELNLKKEALLASVQAEIGKKEMDQMRVLLDARVKGQEMTLAEADQALRAFEVEITARDNASSLQERWVTERRLQEDHEIDLEIKQLDAVATIAGALKPEPAKAAPISLDLSSTVHVKPPQEKAKKNGRSKKQNP